MALRLTNSSIQTGPPAPAELAAQATRLLATGDTDGYRKLFERTAEHDDLSRRYYARVLLLEAGLAATQHAPANVAAKIFLALAQAGTSLLEDEPREPMILNYTGIAFYELWSLDAARSLFGATLSLAPETPHIRRNLEECKRRAKASRGGNPLRGLSAALGPLSKRAKRVAARARPAEGLTLSLCMIVRDEEEMLPRCLAAVKDAVDEIIIVDTGSTDRTIEIAHSFGAQVIEQPWTGSFSDARNTSFDAATGDWMMYLDADEVLVKDDVDEAPRRHRAHVARGVLPQSRRTTPARLATAPASPTTRSACSATGRSTASRVACTSRSPSTSPPTRPSASNSPRCGSSISGTSAACATRGQVAPQPRVAAGSAGGGNGSPFLHFNFGSEYAAAGDAPAALAEFERAWSMVETDPEGGAFEFAPTLIVRLVKALRFCGRPADAIARATDGLDRFPGFTDLVLEQAYSSLALGREADARALFVECIEDGRRAFAVHRRARVRVIPSAARPC